MVARRKDRLATLVAEIEAAGGSALALVTDIADRDQAFAAFAATIEHFGRLDILVNNAGLMILDRVDEADVEDWDRMISINQKGLLAVTKAALPQLVVAASEEKHGVADIANKSSVAGRSTFPTSAVYSMTKYGANGFSEALRQEMLEQHVRVGVIEPGKVDTELDSHNSDKILSHIEENFGGFCMLDPQDLADSVAFKVTRPAHASVAEMRMMPPNKADHRGDAAPERGYALSLDLVLSWRGKELCRHRIRLILVSERVSRNRTLPHCAGVEVAGRIGDRPRAE